jgi:MerR family redox-sensitive transcriptional activator SoxR
VAALSERITIGELAARSGLAPSALRFYESIGLIAAERTAGNHRVYPRSALRRVAFVRAAKQVGVPLQEIREALDSLPAGRTPTKADWERLSRVWRRHLGERIELLERLRDDLTGCIGCGCLSLRSCRLFNAGDGAAAAGSGPRYLFDGQP